MSNILIVESHNDKFFIERLLEVVKQENEQILNIVISNPICAIDDYECLNGLSEAKLELKLNEIKIRIEKDGLDKIGILIDADQIGIENRLKLINRVLKQTNFNVKLEAVNKWVVFNKNDVAISCYIMNCNGFGELETVLKIIKSKESPFSDCLEVWKNCLTQKNQIISDKEFNKFWVNLYQRFDCCDKKEKKQAERKCSFEASLRKNIWDFKHEILNELKQYLRSFTT